MKSKLAIGGGILTCVLVSAATGIGIITTTTSSTSDQDHDETTKTKTISPKATIISHSSTNNSY